MKDALRTKLNVILVAVLAFGMGLGVAAELDLTSPGMAAFQGSSPEIQVGGPDDLRTESARALSEDFARVAERMAPTVVTIEVGQVVRTQRRGEQFPFPFPFEMEPFQMPEGRGQPQYRPGTGSGFIISSDGYIVTNNHVVERADDITVQLSNQREFTDVKVVGRDPTTDVALLKIPAEDLPVAPFVESDQDTRVGEWVLAIGSPGSGTGSDVLSNSITAGIVSAKGRNLQLLSRRYQQQTGEIVTPTIEDFIQTDAVINRGNSGGPLVNMDGEVVGINTAIFSETGFYMGYGFAVPAGLVREVVDDLIQYGEVRRAVLGVTVGGVSAEDAEYYGLDRVGGAVVSGFSMPGGQESPAREAGIEAGDVIVSVEGEAVRSVSDLQRKIRGFQPGESVTVTVVRRSDRERERVDVTLAAMEETSEESSQRASGASERNPLGLEVQRLSQRLRQQLQVPSEVEGVVITEIAPLGPVGRSNLIPPPERSPVVIQDINGRSIRSEEGYLDAVTELEPGSVANLRIWVAANQLEQFVSVRIPEND